MALSSPHATAIDAAATHSLRHEVLRPHQTPADMDYAGDHDELTRHFGVVVGEALVAVGSVYAETRDGGEEPGWRIRGMATAGDWRGHGFGTAVLDACLSHATENGGGEVWCNARTPALSLYERAGFVAVTEVFELPGIGPHVVMVRAKTTLETRNLHSGSA